MTDKGLVIGLPTGSQLLQIVQHICLTAWRRTFALGQLQSQHQPKGPMMTTISEKDRAEVEAMFEAAFCPGAPIALGDDGVRRWLAFRDHVLATHECKPVWRPTTRDEIQPGWEVRSRDRDGFEATWGVAHRQGNRGDWFTEAGIRLTGASLGWTCETTAPLPEPWDEALVGVVSDALAGTEDPGHHWDDDARRVLDALAARGYLDRAAITGGEQS